MSCHWRCWPITSLAVDLSSRQLKGLGAQWTGTAVRKGCQEGMEELGKDVGNGGKESEGSRWRHWREPPVSWNAWEEPAEAIEANVFVECEKVGKPRESGEARQAGKGGVSGTFKGTSGNSRAVRTLCTAEGPPCPGLIPPAARQGLTPKPPKGPPSPTWTLRVCSTGVPVKAHSLHGILFRPLLTHCPCPSGGLVTDPKRRKDRTGATRPSEPASCPMIMPGQKVHSSAALCARMRTHARMYAHTVLSKTLCDPVDTFWRPGGSFLASPADLPNPGIHPGSTALQADPFPKELSGKA